MIWLVVVFIDNRHHSLLRFLAYSVFLRFPVDYIARSCLRNACQFGYFMQCHIVNLILCA